MFIWASNFMVKGVLTNIVEFYWSKTNISISCCWSSSGLMWQYTRKFSKQQQIDKGINKGNVKRMENCRLNMWFKIALIVLMLLVY